MHLLSNSFFLPTSLLPFWLKPEIFFVCLDFLFFHARSSKTCLGESVVFTWKAFLFSN